MTRAPEIYEDIDWSALRQNALTRKGWVNKTPADWDKKAHSFSSRNTDSNYARRLCEKLPLDADSTVLDVGSGPGTLALPMAHRAKAVTALDFSGQMLKILSDQAQEQGLTNISTLHCAWEDDWDAAGVGSHDIVVASRSMGVGDLHGAIAKLEGHALKAIYITDRIGCTPFDPEAFAAVGRSFTPGPDYIYTLNILYTLGIYPEVRIIEIDPVVCYRGEEEAFGGFAWMFKDLTPSEKEALGDYVRSQTEKDDQGWLRVRRSAPVRWALISWNKR